MYKVTNYICDLDLTKPGLDTHAKLRRFRDMAILSNDCIIRSFLVNYAEEIKSINMLAIIEWVNNFQTL